MVLVTILSIYLIDKNVCPDQDISDARIYLSMLVFSCWIFGYAVIIIILNRVNYMLSFFF